MRWNSVYISVSNTRNGWSMLVLRGASPAMTEALPLDTGLTDTPNEQHDYKYTILITRLKLSQGRNWFVGQ